MRRARLKAIWIEHNSEGESAIRIDWDNDRHQRIVIRGDTPMNLICAFKEATVLLADEMDISKI